MKRNRIYEHLPLHFKHAIYGLLGMSLFIMFAALGVLFLEDSGYQSTYNLSEIGLTMIAVGLCLMGVALTALSIALVRLNISRNQKGLTTFALKKYLHTESHNYVFNQTVNISDVLWGLSLVIGSLIFMQIIAGRGF